MTDVVFVFPRVDNGQIFRGFDYHLGAGYVRAYLHENGRTTHQFITNEPLNIGQVADRVLSLSPRVVGLTCYDSNFFLCSLIALAIRERAENVVIITGGPSSTFSPNEVLAGCEAIDLAVRGYGEETAEHILRVLDGEGEFVDVPGISFRSGSTIKSTKERIAGLGVLPSPARKSPKGALDAFPDPYMVGLIPIDRVSDIGIISSRGCSFPCTFCNFAAMSSRKVKDHSIDRVIALFDFIELSAMPRVGIDKIRVSINDDNFSINAGRMREILSRIEGRHYKNLRFWAEMRVDALNAEDFMQMKSAGLDEINIGLDTSVPKVVRAAKKIPEKVVMQDCFSREERYVQQIATSVENAKNSEIDVCVSIILGLPSETPEDGLATLAFVQGLGVSRYAHNYIQVFEGTELAETYSQGGLKVEPYPGRILPLVTEPSYQTHALPILPGDESQLPYRSAMRGYLACMLTGMADVNDNVLKSFGRGSTPHPGQLASLTHIVLYPAAVREIGETKLEECVPLSSLGWLVHRSERYRRQAKQKLSIAGIPLQDVNFLEVGKGRAGEWIKLNRPRRAFGGDAWGLYEVDDQHAAQHPASASPRFRIIKSSNVDALSKMERVLRSTSGRDWQFSPDFLSRPIVVVDGCKWSVRPCPAASAMRVIMENVSVAKPCFDHPGVPVSREFSLEHFSNQVAALQASVTQLRGCRECLARTSCSRCHQITEDPEFCHTKRANADITWFVEAVNLVRRLLQTGLISTELSLYVSRFSRNSADASITIDRLTVPLSETLLVWTSEVAPAFVFHPASNLLSRVPGCDTEVLVALAGFQTTAN